MSQSHNQHPLATILHHCSDPDSPEWQNSWRELIKRYKTYMYSAIMKRCLKFNQPRLNRELNAVADDVFEEVLINICRHRCKALSEFRRHDNETVFMAWLAKICNMTTYTYVDKHYLVPLNHQAVEEMRKRLADVHPEIRSQLYDDCVKIMRGCGGRAPNTERDINIFNLYIWSDFSRAMLQDMPCFKELGHRTVDVVVHRMRTCLRKNRDLVENF
ncbi:MAG: hypothetical protein ACE5IY_17215 [bacterium]